MKKISIYVLSVIAFLMMGCEPAGKELMNTDGIEVVQASETVNEVMRTVHVTVKNTTDELCEAAALKVIYYDEAGKVVGTGNGNALNIPAGETRVVDCLAVDVKNPKRYDVQVDATIWQ